MTDQLCGVCLTPEHREVVSTSETPPWAQESTAPDVNDYLPSEQFVAGALSTLDPFAAYSPLWCLPFARQALDALSEWEPPL